jgi:hypothetical protein
MLTARGPRVRELLHNIPLNHTCDEMGDGLEVNEWLDALRKAYEEEGVR